MEKYKGMPVYCITDEEIIEMLQAPDPKFIFFVEEPEVLSKFFTKVQDTISKLASGYYNTVVKKENVYIVKTKKDIMEEIVMEEIDRPPVGIFCPKPGEFYLITF